MLVTLSDERSSVTMAFVGIPRSAFSVFQVISILP